MHNPLGITCGTKRVFLPTEEQHFLQMRGRGSPLTIEGLHATPRMQRHGDISDNRGATSSGTEKKEHGTEIDLVDRGGLHPPRSLKRIVELAAQGSQTVQHRSISCLDSRSSCLLGKTIEIELTDGP